MVKAVTGWEVTVNELLELGHRRIALMRTFNAREGFERKDDQLPKKFYRPLAGVGPSAGVALSHEELETALDEYYNLSGCTKNGIPTRETLKELDIEWAADYLPA
jgi:aldehyde:ferredoxin oxidoreductase